MFLRFPIRAAMGDVRSCVTSPKTEIDMINAVRAGASSRRFPLNRRIKKLVIAVAAPESWTPMASTAPRITTIPMFPMVDPKALFTAARASDGVAPNSIPKAAAVTKRAIKLFTFNFTFKNISTATDSSKIIRYVTVFIFPSDCIYRPFRR